MVRETHHDDRAHRIELARSINQRSINVRDPEYGAVGDGVVDDTDEIQAAIDAATTDGKNVFLPAGRYIVGKLLLKTGVSLVGEGIDATILQLADNTDDNIIAVSSETTGAVTDIGLLNMTIDGNNANNTVTILVRLAGPEGVNIDNIRIFDSPGDAIYCRNGAKHVRINNFYIDTTGRQGIAVTDGSNITITNGYITGTNNAGIDLEPNNDTDDIRFINIDTVQIESVGSYGISASLSALTTPSGSFTDVSISNVHIRDCSQVAGGSFIRITDIDNVTVTNCSGTTNTNGAAAHGMQFGALNFSCVNYAISNITIDDCDKNGLHLIGSSGITLDRCVVSNISINAANQVTGAFFGLRVDGYVDVYRISNFTIGNTGSGGADLSLSVTGVTDSYVEAAGYGPDLASASTITLDNSFKTHTITGTTNITNINAASGGFNKGREINLIFAGILTFTDGGNLSLAGNFVTTSDDVISMVFDGTNWVEVSRSVN